MLKDIQAILDKINDNRRRYKTWQKVVSVLACITVFCTTYALILPAITLESSPDVICGLEEHTHTSDCYQRTPVLICQEEHEHTDECYQIESVIICGKEEHKHSAECYPVVESDEDKTAGTADGAQEGGKPGSDKPNGSDNDNQDGSQEPSVVSEPTGESSDNGKVTRSVEEKRQLQVIDPSDADADNEASSQESDEKQTVENLAVIPGAKSRLRVAGPKTMKATGGIVLDKQLQEIDNTTYIRLESYVTGEKVSYTVTHTIPSDIVLVLDVSGSMDDHIGRTYTRAPKAQKNSTLVSVINGNRVFLKRKSDNAFVEIRQTNDGNTNYSNRMYNYIDAYTDEVLYSSKGANNIPKFSEKGYEDIIYFMTEDTSSEKWIDVLKTSAESFVNSVLLNAKGDVNDESDDVDHRIAVVTFSSASQIKIGLTDVLTKSKNITDVIEGLEADGHTHPEKALKDAQSILSSVTDSNRAKYVVLFTDGVPGDGATWAVSKKSSETATNAVERATQIKNAGATIFTVGIFDGTDSGSDGVMWSSSTDVNNIAQSAKYANRFMHLVSSNSTDGQTFDKSKDYYISAADSSSLVSAFESVASSVSTGGANITTLTDTTVVQDVVSEYFELKEGSDPSQILVKTAPCTGKNAQTGKLEFGTELDFDTTPVIDGSKVKVTDFDFSSNWCGTDNGSYRGSKLVIYIPIVAKDTFIGGFDVQTNGEGSGIYPPNGDDPVGTFTSPETDVPLNEELITSVLNVSDLCIHAGSTIQKTDLYDDDAWRKSFKDIVSSTYDITVTPDLDNMESKTYTLKLSVQPKTNHGGSDEMTQEFTCHVYVMVPQIKWHDSQVLTGELYSKARFLEHKESEDWVPDGNWTAGSNGVPAVRGTAPELHYTFVDKSTASTFESDSNMINDETKVDVTVQAKYNDALVNVTDVTKFEWECGAPTHGASTIPSHNGSEAAYPEFYIHAYSGAVLPATGGSGIKIWLVIGLTLMAVPVMIGLSIKRKHDLINVF